jgi:predicted GNAT family acetyltransferase
MPEITVSDNPEQDRYDVFVDGQAAGFVEYRLRGERVVFTHAEVDDAFGGQGVGSRLAAEALDDVRSQGKRVTPDCPFIADFIRKHDEYADLVDAEHRGSLSD